MIETTPTVTPVPVTPATSISSFKRFVGSLQQLQQQWTFSNVKITTEQWYGKLESHVYTWLQPETAYNTMFLARSLFMLPLTAFPPIIRNTTTGIVISAVWINSKNLAKTAPWSVKVINSLALTLLLKAIISLARNGVLGIEDTITSLVLSGATLYAASQVEKAVREAATQ